MYAALGGDELRAVREEHISIIKFVIPTGTIFDGIYFIICEFHMSKKSGFVMFYIHHAVVVVSGMIRELFVALFCHSSKKSLFWFWQSGVSQIENTLQMKNPHLYHSKLVDRQIYIHDYLTFSFLFIEFCLLFISLDMNIAYPLIFNRLGLDSGIILNETLVKWILRSNSGGFIIDHNFPT